MRGLPERRVRIPAGILHSLPAVPVAAENCVEALSAERTGQAARSTDSLLRLDLSDDLDLHVFLDADAGELRADVVFRGVEGLLQRVEPPGNR